MKDESGLHRAGIGQRLGAAAIDGALFTLPVMGLFVPVAISIGTMDGEVSGRALGAAFALYTVWLVAIVLLVLTFASMKGGTRGTLGMRAMGTRLVDESSLQPISTRAAAIRYVLLFLTLITVLGAFWPLFDRKHRGLHDRAVGSMTISVSRSRALRRGAHEVVGATEVTSAEALVAPEVMATGGDSSEGVPSSRRATRGTAKATVAKPGPISSVPHFERSPVAEVPRAGAVIAAIPTGDKLPPARKPKAEPVAPGLVEPGAPPLLETAASPSREPLLAADDAEDVDATRVSRPEKDDDIDATRRSAHDEQDVEATRAAVPLGSSAGALLTWDDGSVHAIKDSAVFGRAPIAGDIVGARLVGVDDTTRSLSKTHFAFFVDDGEFFVQDRKSTNGTQIVTVEGETREATPGVRIAVGVGDRLVIGERIVTVGRA